MKKMRTNVDRNGRDKNGFYYRSWLKNRGFPQDQFDGRPVIGICNTRSELPPGNTHFHDRGSRPALESPRRAGSRSNSPSCRGAKPCCAQLRCSIAIWLPWMSGINISANPLDGVVLLMGCDKTTPALLMGAASRTFRRSALRRSRCCAASTRGTI